MTILRAYHSRPVRQAGFTLVELMVGLTIGLFLVLAMSILYANLSQSRSELEKTNRQIENGRYAIELLQSEVQLGGFWGDLVIPAPVMTQTGACETSDFGMATNTDNLPISTFGYASTSTTSSSSTNKPACISTTNSDVLLLRRLSTDTTAVSSVPNPNPSGYVYVQTSACANETAISNTLIVSNSAAALTLTEKDCTTKRAARKLSSAIYYVDNSDFTLRKKQLNGNESAAALVDGIEYIHLEYVLDRLKNGSVAADGLGDGIPDTTAVLASEVNNTCGVSGQEGYCWANVIGIHIYLVARNNESSSGYSSPSSYALGRVNYQPSTDSRKFKKHTYSAFVPMTNPAIRRQTP